MRIRQPGKIRDNLWFLGREESCFYLLEGNAQSMIVSGGISYIVPDVLHQFETFGINEKKIKKLLILHAHFDHVGIVPFLKKRYPKLKVYASARAWELLSQHKVINTINEFSRNVAEHMGMERVYDTYDLDWRVDIIGKSVSEGDRIDLGNLEAQIYETPGHSSCSISAYVPMLKALFASDGGGIPYREMIIASGNSNYTKFQESLEKLKDLDVEYACADHYGFIAGDEAKDFIRKTIVAAKDRRASMEEIYQRTMDIEATVNELASSFEKENPYYIISPEINKGIYRQMVRNIADAMQYS
jgi:glyoxylase-like metal-dependent hydrolase (beta-lactamase superfamily II)